MLLLPPPPPANVEECRADVWRLLLGILPAKRGERDRGLYTQPFEFDPNVFILFVNMLLKSWQTFFLCFFTVQKRPVQYWWFLLGSWEELLTYTLAINQGSTVNNLTFSADSIVHSKDLFNQYRRAKEFKVPQFRHQIRHDVGGKYSDRDKSWSLMQGKSVKTYPDHCI